MKTIEVGDPLLVSSIIEGRAAITKALAEVDVKLDGCNTNAQQRVVVEPDCLALLLLEAVGVDDELESGIGEERFPFGGLLCRCMQLKNLMNLADENIYMTVNVDLPRSQRQSEELLAKSFPNFRQPESTAIVEDFVRGNWASLAQMKKAI